MPDDENAEGSDSVDAVETASGAAASPSIIKITANAFQNWFKTKKAKVAIVGFICITGGLAGLFSYQASAIDVVSLEDALAGADSGSGGGGSGKDPFVKFLDQNGTAATSGTSQEGATSTEPALIEDLNVYEVTVTLTWTDEANTARHTNKPDSFDVEVISPDGRKATGSGSNTQGGEGNIVVTLTRDVSQEAMNNKDLKKKTKETSWSGDWSINITCTNAGDQEAMFSIIGFRDQPDNGNAWNLDIEWKFKAEP